MKNGLLWVGFLVVVVAQGAARIDNSEELRHKYGLSPEFDGLPLHNVKIAILDKGFSGSIKREKNGKWKAADGMLPKSAVVVEDYAKLYGNECSGSKGPVSFAESEHGGVVAQTAWAVAGRDPLGPKFYLLNTNGLPNFRCAVRYAREVAKVDIIVYSHNFEYGGNFDGKGFINAIVNEATADGILWFNAAGNYAGQVYNGPAKDDITLHVRSNVSENKVSIKAAWSGASDFVEIGSKNDYDLLVFQPDGTPIPVKNYKQVVKKTPPKKKKVEPDAASDKVVVPPVVPGPETGDEAEELPAKASSDAQKQAVKPQAPQEPEILAAPAAETDNEQDDDREEDTLLLESVDLELDRNDPDDPDETYEIRLVKKGGAFNETDFVRVTLVSNSEDAYFTDRSGAVLPKVELVEATQNREIMIPADNPNVITVGDREVWSSRGPTMDGRVKPNVLMLDSKIIMDSSRTYSGTSFGAPMLAGITALYIATMIADDGPKPKREHILRLLQSGTTDAVAMRIPEPGYLPDGSRPTTMEYLKNNHSLGDEIIDALKFAQPETVFEPFLTGAGGYVLAMNEWPLTLTNIFPSKAALNEKLGIVRRTLGRDSLEFIDFARFHSIMMGAHANPEAYEYYLSVRSRPVADRLVRDRATGAWIPDPADRGKFKTVPLWYVRPTEEVQDPKTGIFARFPYPWERFKKEGFQRSDFIELCYVKYKEAMLAGRSIKNLFRTDITQEEVIRIVRGL